jgi:hypothetical protein
MWHSFLLARISTITSLASSTSVTQGNVSIGDVFGWPIVVALIAVIATAGLTEFVLRNFRMSNLTFEPVKKDIQPTEMVWRLPIKNTGSYAALDCRADVEAIYDAEWKFEGDEIREEVSLRLGVIAAPLNWTHNDPQAVTRHIYPGQTAHLDICLVENRDGVMIPPFHLSNPHVWAVRNSTNFTNSARSVEVGLYQANGQHYKVTINISWGDAYAVPGIGSAILTPTPIVSTVYWRPGIVGRFLRLIGVEGRSVAANSPAN